MCRDVRKRPLLPARGEELTEKTRQFVLRSGLRGTDARRLRSNIYSFISYNGVLI